MTKSCKGGKTKRKRKTKRRKRGGEGGDLDACMKKCNDAEEERKKQQAKEKAKAARKKASLIEALRMGYPGAILAHEKRQRDRFDPIAGRRAAQEKLEEEGRSGRGLGGGKRRKTKRKRKRRGGSFKSRRGGSRKRRGGIKRKSHLSSGGGSRKRRGGSRKRRGGNTTHYTNTPLTPTERKLADQGWNPRIVQYMHPANQTSAQMEARKYQKDERTNLGKSWKK